MFNHTRVLPIALGAIILGLVAWTIHSAIPAAPLRTQSESDRIRRAARRLDAEKRAMSPAERANAETEARDQNLKDVANSWTKTGVYTTADQGIRLGKLGDTAIAKGSLPPADVDYLVQTILDPQTASNSPGYIHFQAAYDLEQMKHFTEDQKSKILGACLPLLKSKAILDRRCAIVIARAIHSPAAVPAALAMVRGDNENNKKAAQQYLDSLGNLQVDHQSTR